jgi:serine/threonine protein kinase
MGDNCNYMTDFDCNGWKYSSNDRIGSGGQGTVFRAINDSYKGEYALKYFDFRGKRGEMKKKAKERFKKELLIPNNISHPNIIKFVDGGKDTTDRYYIVMELADKNLNDWIAEREYTLDEKIELFTKILDGVEALHTHDPPVYHRDLKPANILFVNGEVKISDFGIAFILDENERYSNTRERVGSYFWMPPGAELGRDDTPSPIFDCYSLGKILYFLLSDGKILFREYFEKPQYFLPYLHLDPRYMCFKEIFERTCTDDPRDRLDIDGIREFLERVYQNFQEYQNYTDDLLALAHAFHLKTRYEKYKLCIEKAYDINPDDPYVLYFYGHKVQMDGEDPWIYYDKVIDSNIEDPNILGTLISFYHGRDDMKGTLGLSNTRYRKLAQRTVYLHKAGKKSKNINSLENVNRFMRY